MQIQYLQLIFNGKISNFSAFFSAAIKVASKDLIHPAISRENRENVLFMSNFGNGGGFALVSMVAGRN